MGCSPQGPQEGVFFGHIILVNMLKMLGGLFDELLFYPLGSVGWDVESNFQRNERVKLLYDH